jgi:hypothetical protein
LSGAVVEIDFCGVSGKSAPTGADGLYQVDGFTSGSSGCGRVRYMVTVAGFAPLHEEVPEPPVHGAWNVVSRDVVLVRAGGRLYLPHAEQVAAGP